MKISVEKDYTIRTAKDLVWKALTDFSRETEYWGNIKDITVLKEDGNLIVREATVGPMPFGARTKQTVTFVPQKAILVKIEGASMSGDRTIHISENGSEETKVKVEWNLEIKEVPAFVQGIVSGQLTKATDRAIKMIQARSIEES